jgi:Glycosyltransferase family 87
MRSGSALAGGPVPSLRLHAYVKGGLRGDGAGKAAATRLATSLVSLGRRGRAAVAIVIYAALSVALFSSTWVHPASWSIGVVGDPQQLMWFMGWSPFALTHGLNPLFTSYIDYPGGVNLMWNASLLLPATVLGPLTALAGFVVAYNVLMTLAVALSAWTAYLLIRRYVSSQVAAGVGGALYGFSPFMTAHSLGHSQLTLAFMPPILLLLLDETVHVQRRRPYVSGLLLGVAAAAQLLTGEELLAITALAGFLLLCLAVAMRPDQVRPHLRHAVIGLVSAAIVFLILVAVPIGFQFFGPQHIFGAAHTPNIYVNDAFSFIVPTRLMLLSPAGAIALSDRFSGNVVEASSYVGVLLALLLAFITVRYWRRLEVRLAALTSVLVTILSMGITIHIAGKNTTIPVFVLGVVFLLVQRNRAGWLMVFLTFFGWLAMSRLPVLNNILPARLMLVVYLLAGLLIAVWLDEVREWGPQQQWLGWLAAAASLVLLLPAVPYPSSQVAIPAFFAGGAASRIPEGSVALVVPFSISGDARAMIWQEQTGMRFRMPEGYAFIPDPGPRRERLSPPPSATQSQAIAVAQGRAGPLTDQTRQQILSELRSWHVQTVVIGPMTNEQQEVDLFTSLFGQAPEPVDGVYAWWGVDALLSRP